MYEDWRANLYARRKSLYIELVGILLTVEKAQKVALVKIDKYKKKVFIIHLDKQE
ncbi:MAG: hypothetical protein ACK42Z_06420 [Candidatus Kapaibacteriota bacterium]